MAAATALFVVALAGLLGLYGLKRWELVHGMRVFPGARAYLDGAALALKHTLVALRDAFRRLPAHSVALGRFFVHVGATQFARAARTAEHAAHRLADRVSHKHRFERGETTSRFLKEVSEHKNGLVSGQ